MRTGDQAQCKERGLRPCHREIAAFNVANEITYKFYLNGFIRFIRTVPVCELVLKQDC